MGRVRVRARGRGRVRGRVRVPSLAPHAAILLELGLEDRGRVVRLVRELV